MKKPVPLCSNYFSHFLCMLTVGSRFKARLQVPQNVFSSRFLWNFAISLCFFLVFQEAEIHSAGLRPSISMYDLHQFTLFASSGSHRHTSLQNPLPEAMAIIFHRIHFLPILISPSHPCHSQLPPRRISLPRPRPLLVAASTAAPAASSRWTTASWPFCAARCSDVQPRRARRGGWSWRFSKLHGEVVFPIQNDAKAMEIFVGLATGLGSTWETCSYITFITHARKCALPVKLSLYWKISLTSLQSWAVGKLCAALFYPAKASIQNCLTVKGFSWSLNRLKSVYSHKGGTQVFHYTAKPYAWGLAF